MGSTIRVEHIGEMFPNEFKRLKRVKAGNSEHINFHQILLHMVAFYCFLSFPFATSDTTHSFSTVTVPHKPALITSFMHINRILRGGGNEVQDDWSATILNLKTIDFSLFPSTFADVNDNIELHLELHSFPAFIQILEACVIRNISLMNVPSHWFLTREEFPELDPTEYGPLVKSLVNLQPSVISLKLDNLESIEIKRTTESAPGIDWREQRVDWPSLKSLDITVDALYSYAWYHYPETEEEEGRNAFPMYSSAELFQFFFEGIKRPSLVELRLNFLHSKPIVYIPKIEDIISSCPNLKKLTIVNWPGRNKELAKLWSGLPKLEEVSLENCTTLGSAAFIGDDPRFPVFLKLKELKKLSLKGLDQMPKITDTLFSSVIRHMELTHFTLTSDQPVKTVTEAGIESLLDGDFADSIEEFSFKGWSLADLSQEKFRKLEAKFPI